MVLALAIMLIPLDYWLWVQVYKLKVKEYLVSFDYDYKTWKKDYKKDYILTKLAVAVATTLVYLIVLFIASIFFGGIVANLLAAIMLSLGRVFYTTAQTNAYDAVNQFLIDEKKSKKARKK